MELKDMILSTLAELEVPKDEIKEGESTSIEDLNLQPNIKIKEAVKEESTTEISLDKDNINEEILSNKSDDEKHFYESMRERILVLFEGFQSPNNKSIEAKVDLTLNFLEYLLAVIDERLETLDKK